LIIIWIFLWKASVKVNSIVPKPLAMYFSNMFLLLGRKSLGRYNRSGDFPFIIPTISEEVRFELGVAM
jgi:hypothetical protein